MFTRVKNLAKSHWKKVVIGGVVVQGLIVGAKYVTNRFLEYHEAQASNVFKKMKKEHHFESMDVTFKTSFVALSTGVKEMVLKSLDAQSLTEQLKGGNLSIEAKLELWERLKLIGFTRILVTVYGTSLLSVLLRIQLSVISGYLFLESNETERRHEWRNVDGIILSNNTAMDIELQQKYLSLATHLVRYGVQKLCDSIYTRVAVVVGSVGLKEKITVSELERMFLCIVAGVNQDIITPNPDTTSSTRTILTPGMSPVKYPWQYVFPPEVVESFEKFPILKCQPHYEPPDMYERLLSETFDLLDSDDVIGLLGTFERQGVSHFCDRVGDYVKTTSSVPNGPISPAMTIMATDEPSSAPQPPTAAMFAEVPIPMAKIIPMLNGLVGQGGMSESDPWLSILLNSEVSRTLGANVYESFSTTCLD